MTDQITETKTVTEQDLKSLAEFRKQSANLAEKIVTLNNALKETPEFKALEEAKGALAAVEEQASFTSNFIRKAALEQFNETKTKPTIAGVTVKIFKLLKYEKAAAESWAREKMPELFKLDEKGFEKYAKAVADTVPVPCVTFEEDPRVEIASDLSMYL